MKHKKIDFTKFEKHLPKRRYLGPVRKAALKKENII